MSRNKRQLMVETKFVCPDCGTIISIPRKKGDQHPTGHIKHMHCYKCKETTGFVEIKQFDRNVAFWTNYQAQAARGKELLNKKL